jgi:hypothetical protein
VWPLFDEAIEVKGMLFQLEILPNVDIWDVEAMAMISWSNDEIDDRTVDTFCYTFNGSRRHLSLFAMQVEEGRGFSVDGGYFTPGIEERVEWKFLPVRFENHRDDR